MDELVKRIVLVGDTGVGKTALLTSYADNVYQTDHMTTMGVDFRHVRIRIDTPRNQVLKLQLWDTAGHERYRSITNTYYRGAQLILLVYDVTRRTSFESLAEWMRSIREYTDAPIVLVANKVDVAHREVREAEGRAFAADEELPYIEASAKTAYNLTEVFERHVGNAGSAHLSSESIILKQEQEQEQGQTQTMARKGFWGC